MLRNWLCRTSSTYTFVVKQNEGMPDNQWTTKASGTKGGQLWRGRKAPQSAEVKDSSESLSPWQKSNLPSPGEDTEMEYNIGGTLVYGGPHISPSLLKILKEFSIIVCTATLAGDVASSRHCKWWEKVNTPYPFTWNSQKQTQIQLGPWEESMKHSNYYHHLCKMKL